MLTDSDPTVPATATATAIRSVAKGCHPIEPELALASVRTDGNPLAARGSETCGARSLQRCSSAPPKPVDLCSSPTSSLRGLCNGR
jgi:hypothetical protein